MNLNSPVYEFDKRLRVCGLFVNFRALSLEIPGVGLEVCGLRYRALYVCRRWTSMLGVELQGSGNQVGGWAVTLNPKP